MLPYIVHDDIVEHAVFKLHICDVHNILRPFWHNISGIILAQLVLFHPLSNLVFRRDLQGGAVSFVRWRYAVRSGKRTMEPVVRPAIGTIEVYTHAASNDMQFFEDLAFVA